MIMKKIIACLSALCLLLSLCSCEIRTASIVNTTAEAVDAIVYDCSIDNWGYRYVWVAYGPCKTRWVDEWGVHEQYKDNLGSTIRCYLITHEYDDGSVKYTLVYNETLHNGVPEGEPIHPEDYTFPEGVE